MLENVHKKSKKLCRSRKRPQISAYFVHIKPGNMTNEEMRHKINDEIIVDCYGDYEVNMSWYYFFEDTMEFPFEAETVMKDRNGKKQLIKVDVLGMAEEDDFEELSEVLFEVNPKNAELVIEVGISKLKKIKGSKEIQEAFELWGFWKSENY